MTPEVDSMLERINQVLRECDARVLPPLMSGKAAAAIDLAEQAGYELTAWQKSTVLLVCADPGPDAARQAVDSMRSTRLREVRALAAGEPIVDEVVDYVGFEVEPRPDRIRGWLLGWFARFNRGGR